MFKAIGSLFIVPATMLLTLSFFVLVVNQKQEKFLRLFGWAIAVLLWLSAFMVFTTGNYIGSNGHEKMMGMRKQRMMSDCQMMKDAGMPCMMMRGTFVQDPMVQKLQPKCKKTMPMKHNGKKMRTKAKATK